MWILVKDELPSIYRQILMAYPDHWNGVCGFYSGLKHGTKTKHEWYYHTPDQHNQKTDVQPFAWMYVEDVPHRRSSLPCNELPTTPLISEPDSKDE